MMISLTFGCPEDQYCRSCDLERGRCLWCTHSYLDPRGICIPDLESVPNCTFYRLDPLLKRGVCLQCGFGFRLSKGVCEACSDPLCAICFKKDTCFACFGGRLYNSQSCTSSPIPDNDDYCAIRSVSGDCIECARGRALVHQEGITFCKNAPPGCEELDDEGLKCQKCASGYYVSARGCKELPPPVPTPSSRHYIIEITIGLLLFFGIVATVFILYMRKIHAHHDHLDHDEYHLDTPASGISVLSKPVENQDLKSRVH